MAEGVGALPRVGGDEMDCASGTAASAIRHHRVTTALDLEEVFANMPRWQIEHEVLARPEGPSANGMLLLDGIGLTANRLGARVRTTGSTPAGQFAIAFDLGSPPGRKFGGRALAPGDVLFGYSGAELDYLHPAGFNDLSLILPGALVEAVLGPRLDDPLPLERFRTGRVGVAERQRHPGLWRLLATMGRILHGEAPPPRTDTALGHLRTDVLDAVGTAVRLYAEASPRGDRTPWHQARPIALRAVEFMRAHLGEPLSLAQICAAARASERTVEYAFHALYGVGAKRYLKILRLNRVRHRLRDDGAEPLAIQDLAADSGFWHMGHFSTDYRLFFGETPSQTMRRSRGGD